MAEAVRKRRCLTCSTEFSANAETVTCPADGALLAPINEDPLLGTLFDGKYEISEMIGEGGFGRVYKARHVLLQKTVALKVLLADLQNMEGLNRFQTEARATNQLAHPNLVCVFDYGISPRPYIVMEYVEGITLDVIVEREGPLSIERFVAMFDQICQGMSAAHEKKLLHRDLKPSNIIVDSHTGTPKVLDFGVVKVFGEDKTATGQTVGSPPYMSPEQCMGKDLDARADVYSLGCVMYEALSGMKAFDGENAVECMYKHFNLSPKPVSQIRKGPVPRGLDYLIARTMADYSDRYQSMEDLRKDLLKVAEGTMSKRLPKISRVTYRKTVKVLAEFATVGNWTIISCAAIIYLLLLWQ
jgi:serine/threonine protein kinase